MKFVITLIVIVAVFFGGIVLYNKYFKKETSTDKPIPAQVVNDETKQAGASTENATGLTHEKIPGDFKKTGSSSTTAEKPKTLITAETPIKSSRWGKKIDKIYMKHNDALEKAAGDN